MLFQRHRSVSLISDLPLVVPILVAAILLLVAVGCEQVKEPSVASSRTAGTVELTIKLSQPDDDLVVAVPCSDDSTVFSIMERAKNMGDLDFEARGTGETVFLNSIQGVENGGASGDNWVYCVNGELADKSCGVFEVKPKDKIVWSYGQVEF